MGSGEQDVMFPGGREGRAVLRVGAGLGLGPAGVGPAVLSELGAARRGLPSPLWWLSSPFFLSPLTQGSPGAFPQPPPASPQPVPEAFPAPHPLRPTLFEVKKHGFGVGNGSLTVGPSLCPSGVSWGRHTGYHLPHLCPFRQPLPHFGDISQKKKPSPMAEYCDALPVPRA